MFRGIFSTLIVLFTTTISMAQALTIINNTASNKNSRTLYIGLENHLKIQGEAFKGIAPQAGVVTEKNNIIIRPAKPGAFTITFLTSNGNVPVTFNVKNISDVVVTIEGQTNKKVSKDLLLSKRAISLQPVDKDTLFDRYKVVSFSAQLNGQTFEILGKDFSNELLSVISTATKGDTISICDVKAFNENINLTCRFNKRYSFELE